MRIRAVGPAAVRASVLAAAMAAVVAGSGAGRAVAGDGDAGAGGGGGGGAAPGTAAADAPDVLRRRAELAEYGLGDLETAAKLYRDAALAAAAAPDRATCEIREAACLRRLGRPDEARALLLPWASERAGVPAAIRLAAAAELERLGTAPATVPGSAAAGSAEADAAARLAEKEREFEQELQRLEDAFNTKRKGFEDEIAALARRVRERDAELERRRVETPSPVPSTAEEVLAQRKREIARARQVAQQLATAYVRTARVLHQDGNFAEARVFLRDALERDPENAEAKVLLARVCEPLGIRETLFQEALKVAALAREVRDASLAAEVTDLTDEARRRQDRGDFAGSSAPLERASAILGARPGAARSPAVRDDVLRMLQAAAARGVPRAPVPPPPPDAGDERWTSALHELLATSGREVAQGLELRFHDLSAVVAAAGLPPVPFGADPTGWTITTRDVASPPLIAAWLQATEARAMRQPGADVELVGSTCAVLADMDTQTRLAERLTRLGAGIAPAADLRIMAYRVAHATVADALASRGVVPVQLADGAAAATLEPADLDALAQSMAGIATGVIGGASLRATPLRAFRLVAGPGSARLTLDLVPVPGARPGVGLRTEVQWTGRRSAGPALRAESFAGAEVSPGGGLVVFGIPDPERPESDAAVIVRLGEARAPATEPVPRAPAPAQSADEIRIPAAVASTEDPPAPALLVPEHPVPSRTEALLRRLREIASRATTVDVRGDRVLVVGPDEARRAVSDFVARLSSETAPLLLDVRVHQVAPAAEKRILDLCPRAVRAPSGAFWGVVLAAGKESRDVEYFLRAAQGAIPAREPVVAATPTGRVDAARIIRTPYRSSPGTTDGGRAWGRADASWTEEGLVVSLRPFGRRADGRVDLDVSARARWVEDAGRRNVETPLGRVPVSDPRTASWWGDVPVALGRGETFVLFGAASPFSAGGADQVVVTVRLAE